MEPVNAPEQPIYSTGPYSMVLKQPQPDKDHLVLRSPDVVHILPITTEDQVVLLRQPATGLAAASWRRRPAASMRVRAPSRRRGANCARNLATTATT